MNQKLEAIIKNAVINSDLHTHSKYSDGKFSLSEIVEQAISNGLKSIGFTDHAPTPTPNKWAMLESKLGDYLKEARSIQAKYKEKIQVLVGLEVDYFPDHHEFLRKLPLNQLDYVIGSLHFLPVKGDSGNYLGIDSSKELFEAAVEKCGGIQKTVELYYSTLKSAVEIKEFDIIGHFDVIKKFNVQNCYFDDSQQWYEDLAYSALRVLKSNKKILEINVSAKRKGLSEFFPSEKLIKYANWLEIPTLVTSDAHYLSDILKSGT